ncbi:peptidoglycan-binding domain-containing protein [Falsirhodobacter halotolerans]|uniref:peptidoglycan-binding domain-containing protein n=1 Tax=Falsirhodobacter halotolerans TaxID=1146892 RepID=UPI001FD1BF87|nr:peptidoglycan-binding domain-containing protein [Falsirhodobacter halotolerans]MCJ8138886.1 peptidoglycan-binding protein [Falsirhodobacter halotolerans]
MTPRLLSILLTALLAGCGFPHVDDPTNLNLAGAPKGVEAEGECWIGPDIARLQTLCGGDLTPDRVATLQRALAARQMYDGPVDGGMGAATRAAIARYQAVFGRDTGDLTIPAAKALGVIPGNWPDTTPTPVTEAAPPR